MQKITPFLWFDGNLEEAMNLYASVFKNSKIVSMNRSGKDGPVMSATIELDGQEFYAFNGGPEFTFTPAVSFFVKCETQDEIDRYWEMLSKGGEKKRCGWLTDKFGLSWQIVPISMGAMLQDKDPVKAKNVMRAMLQMTKLDIATLKAAYDQE